MISKYVISNFDSIYVRYVDNYIDPIVRFFFKYSYRIWRYCLG